MPSSPRTKPLSILSQFKPRAHRQKSHKQTGSDPSPPSLDKAPSRPATALRVDRMAPTLKDRSGRLQAFARGTPEAATPQNHSHDHTHRNRKRSETPQAAVPTAPSRQELVDSAKLPIPKNGRYASPHQRDGSVASQPLPPQSPPRVRDPSQIRRPRAGSHDRQDARDPHEALFNGSQLSEGFMNSGLTTPQNEREDPGLEAAHRIKKSPAPHNVHPLFRTQFEPAARSSEDAAFLVGDDGFMTVISASGRHAPPNMKDGFHDVKMNDHGTNGEPHRNGNQLPTSPVERQAKLPVREVKVRRANSNRREDPSLPDEPRVLSPTLESSRWQARNKSNGGERPTLFRDVDLEIDSYAELEPHTTPKGPKAKAPPQRTLMESSMPVTSASRNEPREKKRRRGSLDYDDKALSSMAYEQLLQEDFDYDPAAVAAQSNSGSKSDDYASVLTRFLQQSEKEQRNMFANMSIKDWELSGDWFIDQFADLMHRLRDARQNKRRIVRKFEDEIAHREEMVRLRSEVIDRKLVKMKQDGQRVVEDKEL